MLRHENSDDVRDLILNARDDNLEEVRRLLDLGVSPDAFCNDYAGNALHAAALNNHPTILTLLINRGGNPNVGTNSKVSNYRGEPPLEWAAQEGADDAIRVLLDNNADINMRRGDGITALFRAVYSNKLSTVRLLLAHHADITTINDYGNTTLSCAVIDNKNLECTTILVDHIKQEYQDKPLELLAYLQNKNEFASLISNASSKELFLKLMELIDFLLEKGIDLKAISQLLPAKHTLKFKKFKESLFERFETLPANTRLKLYNEIMNNQDHPYHKLFYIKRGVIFGLFGKPCEPGKGTLGEIKDALGKINEKINELGAQLYSAAFYGDLNLVNDLLTRCAPVNWKNKNGATPLYIAARRGHPACVEALLKAGAKVNQPKHDGATPLFMAAQEGHKNIVKTLLDHHADISATLNSNEESLRQFASDKSPEIRTRMSDFIERQPDKNAIQMTALEIAGIMGHDDIAAILQQTQHTLTGSSTNLSAVTNLQVESATIPERIYYFCESIAVALYERFSYNDIEEKNLAPSSEIDISEEQPALVNTTAASAVAINEATTPAVSSPASVNIYPNLQTLLANSQSVAAYIPTVLTAIEMEPVVPSSLAPVEESETHEQHTTLTASEQVFGFAAKCTAPVMSFTASKQSVFTPVDSFTLPNATKQHGHEAKKNVSKQQNRRMITE